MRQATLFLRFQFLLLCILPTRAAATHDAAFLVPPLSGGSGKRQTKGETLPNRAETFPVTREKKRTCLAAISRREVIRSTSASIAGGTTGLATAEGVWRTFVDKACTALAAEDGTPKKVLPPGTLAKLEAGRAVVIDNWLTPDETRALCSDAKECFAGGNFKNFILSRNPKKLDKNANDRWIMPSFASRQGTDGPFADPAVGNLALRNRLKARMAAVKAELAHGLRGRESLANDVAQTHEMEYLRYGPGALLNRHTDEHHLELKRPHGSRLPLKPHASRRSVTWLVYLNEGWTHANGGQLRLHEREFDSAAPVGARNRNDLQVGWLKAVPSRNLPEQPVFLDPFQELAEGGDENESCRLYTCDDDATSAKRFLSSKPFANVALYLGGGDALARRFMVEDPVDRQRFHLIDAPKNLVSEAVKLEAPPGGPDGGERVRDILPKAGTLVLFDSVSLPHEVLVTNQERFGVQGWFHETIAPRQQSQ